MSDLFNYLYSIKRGKLVYCYSGSAPEFYLVFKLCGEVVKSFNIYDGRIDLDCMLENTKYVLDLEYRKIVVIVFDSSKGRVSFEFRDDDFVGDGENCNLKDMDKIIREKWYDF